MKYLDRFINENFLMEVTNDPSYDPSKYTFDKSKAEEAGDQPPAPEGTDGANGDGANNDGPSAEQKTQLGYTRDGLGGIDSVNGDFNGDNIPDEIKKGDDGKPVGTLGGPLKETSMSEKSVDSFWQAAIDHSSKQLADSRAATGDPKTETEGSGTEDSDSTADAEKTEKAVTESSSSSETGAEGDTSTGDNQPKAAGAPKTTVERLASGEIELPKGTGVSAEPQELLGQTQPHQGDYIESVGEGQYHVCPNGVCDEAATLDSPRTKSFSELETHQQDAVLSKYNEMVDSGEIDVPETSVPNPTETPSVPDETNNDDPAIPQPRETVDVARALKLTSEDGKATVVRRGDGVDGDPNHDNAEARSYLLDGQLDSEKNTFSTFEINGEKYLGFYSDGYGAGDERSGVVKLSDIEGKNLGADGWKAASADQVAMLKSAHEARQAEIAKFGGIDNYNQAESIRETVARLQAHSTTKEGDEYKVNGEGASAEQIEALNNIMTRLNNFGEPLAGIKSDLDAILSEQSSQDGKTLADDVLEQRVAELEGQGFSKEQIAELKKDGITNEELDKAIDDKRNEAHKLSAEEAQKFNETLEDLKSRKASLTPQQQAMVDRLEQMAANGGLDKMGKYLQTELGNLSAKAPKPQTEGSRGDNDTVDFTKGSGQAFRDAFLTDSEGKKLTGDELKKAEEEFKKIFGDNDKLSGVIKDFDSLSDIGKKAFVNDLKKLSSEKDLSPEQLATDINKSIEEAQTKIEEDGKKLEEGIAKLQEKIDAEETSEKDKAEAQEKLEEAKKLQDKLAKATTLIQESKKRADLLANYSKDSEGALYRAVGEDKVSKLSSGEVGTLKDGSFEKDDTEAEQLAKAIIEANPNSAEYKNIAKLIEEGKLEEGSIELTTSPSTCGPCRGLEKEHGKVMKLLENAGILKVTDQGDNSGGVPRFDKTPDGISRDIASFFGTFQSA